ncbi:DUF4198 domain-containing protein [Ramlibacter rhizophilus]|uniref:DUF4198 domain-containing protein n=1 Tax=Ramlibacter rhizophilus TaxID=1781167 RepID=A0A4Z0BTF6_9BURK|nr:DUF4198 domain-containing protein [Ramlibacter rhizophilus]TFZ01305.1 DUF4198 domain-containing protein [Ramlibacter rhizophilus]
MSSRASARRPGPARRWLAGALTACALAPAAAHDTWLQVLDAPAAGLLELAASTGPHFPAAESAPSMDGLAASGCIDAQGRAIALRARLERPTALILRTRAEPQAALSCWIETRPQRVTLGEAEVETYLREIQAPAELRERWQQQRRAGAPWQESFVKQARLEHTPQAPADPAALRMPRSRGLEIRLLGDAPVQVGQALRAEVLLDGQPLAGQAVQLLGERLPLGPWRRSDARGQLEFPPLPLAGHWLLRSTRLLPPETPEGEWRSRFSTLLVLAP